MKFSPVIAALVAATVVAATPASFAGRDTTSVELNDADLAAIDYLAARGGLADGASLEARGQFAKRDLHITFHDPTGPVSPATQKEITKVLQKHISKEDQKKFPFCDANIGDGGSGNFRCFKTAAKKIGDQGPAGGFKV